uniref:Uncharacterized protein n=1 Tax=Noctiluca scintillans TaxID=2966 RepID=A0A7S1F9I6_NOCSC
MATTGISQELGTRPVLLNNPNGWANVTRFTTLTMARLADLERKSMSHSLSGLQRTLQRIERRQMREGFASLRCHASVNAFVHARRGAEDMLQRLHALVEAFDVDVDNLVEEIMQGTLVEDDDTASLRA